MEGMPSRRKRPIFSHGKYAKMLERALPPLPEMDGRSLQPNEPAQAYYMRLELFRRICEARTVLRWMTDRKFNIDEYMGNVIEKRGKDSAIILYKDLASLFAEVIKREPSLREFLHPQLKLCCRICHTL